jgi:hypothetical protein
MFERSLRRVQARNLLLSGRDGPLVDMSLEEKES